MGPEEVLLLSHLASRIVLDDQLFKAMRQNKLLTSKQEAKIRRAGDEEAQKKTLIDLLPKLGRDAFKMFSEALIAAKQEDVVQRYLDPGARPKANDEEEAFDEIDSAPVDDPSVLHQEHMHMENANSPKASYLDTFLTIKPVKLPGKEMHTVDQNLQNVPQRIFPLAMKIQFTKEEEIVNQLVPKFIKNTKKSSSEFWDLFKRVNDRIKLPFLGITDGMTMLHLIVLHNRLDYLDVVFNIGIWDRLVDVQAEGNTENCKGLTAIEMAQKLNQTHIWKHIDRLSREEESMNVWHKAARLPDEARIDEMLREKPSPYVLNETSVQGKTVLYWAATSGKLSVMDKLVKGGSDIFPRTDAGDTIMTRIVSLNHAHLVRPLVTEWGLDPEQPGLNRKTPLYIAAENGSIETFKALLDVGVAFSGLALVSAAVSGKTHFMLTLMNDYNITPDWKDIMGKTALLAAAAARQISSINTLLEKGADIIVVDKRKRNILHFAIESGSEAMLKRILEVCKQKNVLQSLLNAQDVFNGAECIFLVKGKDQGRPAWHYVLVKRNITYLFREKTQGGPIDVVHYGTVVKSGWGIAPSNVVSYEIEQMYSPDKTDPTAPLDLTPLMLAIMKEQHSLFKILLKEKPALDIQDSNGLTALHLACMKGCTNFVKDLVHAGCRTDITDKDGNTPLHIAKMNQQSVVVTYLEGRTNIKQVKKFVFGDLAKANRGLDSRTLEEIQNKQQDVTRYVVDVLRDLQADINQLLYEMGSAPIGQESPENPEEAEGCNASAGRVGPQNNSAANTQITQMTAPNHVQTALKCHEPVQSLK